MYLIALKRRAQVVGDWNIHSGDSTRHYGPFDSYQAAELFLLEHGFCKGKIVSLEYWLSDANTSTQRWAAEIVQFSNVVEGADSFLSFMGLKAEIPR